MIKHLKEYHEKTFGELTLGTSERIQEITSEGIQEESAVIVEEAPRS